MDYDDTQSGYGQDLIKFLYCLRMLVRDTNAVAFITVPSHLFDVSFIPISKNNYNLAYSPYVFHKKYL